MAVLGTLDLLRPPAHHSTRHQCLILSNTWPCKRTPTFPKSIINIGRNRWNYNRMTLSPSALARPLTTSSDSSQLNTSSEVEIKEDENKFNWFQNWYPVALEYDLDKRVPHAFTVLGLDIVVWWDKREQAWRAFDDNCPHRRAPLSEGRIDEDGDLQCSYHGWCFGSRGECKHIPQAPLDGPPVHTSKRACVHVYPSVQQQGIIWVWPNTNPLYRDISLEQKAPFIPVLSDPSFQSDFSMRELPYGYEILTENLMDPSHLPYAHHGLVAHDLSITDLKKMGGRAGKPLNFHVQDMDKSGFQGQGEMGPVKFVAPCIFVMENTFPPSKKGKIQTLISGTKEKKMESFFFIFLCVPVAPGRSRLISFFPRNFALWTNLFNPRWIFHIRQNLLVDSDLYFLHLEEHKLHEYGPKSWAKACYVPTKADAFVVAFRKWLNQYSTNGIPWGRKFNGSLPPTPPKELLMDRWKSHVEVCGKTTMQHTQTNSIQCVGYWSHVVKCRTCKNALRVFRGLEIITQVLSIVCVAMLGVNAINKQTLSPLYIWNVGGALAFFLTSRWLSHFIYKSYYFHDYNHALIK